jgi:hypothetical protein
VVVPGGLSTTPEDRTAFHPLLIQEGTHISIRSGAAQGGTSGSAEKRVEGRSAKMALLPSTRFTCCGAATCLQQSFSLPFWAFSYL